MLQSLLNYDTSLLIFARSLVSVDYARLIQVLGETVVIWGALILLALWFHGLLQKDVEKKRNALRIFFTIVSVFLIYGIVNLWIPQWRPSPQTVVGGIDPLIKHPLDNSFPSGHALFSIALIVGIFKFIKKPWLTILTIIIALITTSARVIGGVHYPGDILGGFLIGGITAVLLSPCITSKWMEEKVYPMLIKIAGWLKL